MPRRVPQLFGAPDASPGFLLWQVTNLWQRRQREALKPLGLSHVQFVLLAGVTWLADHGESPVSQVKLARHARTDPMMTSQVLRTLQEKKLVRRVPHPTDSRAKALLPTAAGRRLARQAMYVVERADQEFFAALGSDVAKLTAMMREVVGAGGS
jgi:DNA-binding MarR family transcriptional regulator